MSTSARDLPGNEETGSSIAVPSVTAIVTDGTAQDDRRPAAFRDGYVRVDDRSFEQLLAHCSNLASNLRFFDLDNTASGTWADLFLSNEIFLIARISAIDTVALERDYREASESGEPARAADIIVAQARRLDAWQVALSRSEAGPGRDLGLRIAELIRERLRVELHGVADWLLRQQRLALPAGVMEGAPLPLELSGVWNVAEDGETLESLASGLGETTEAPSDSRFLESRFHAFLKTLVYVKRAAEKSFRAALTSRTVNPALGLTIAFLGLFGRLQERSNRFAARHRRFFYDQILGCRPLDGDPDSAEILLLPDGTKRDFRVRRGTKFSAGFDDTGRKRLYATDRDVLVGDIAIDRVLTLYCEKDPMKSPENVFAYITRVGVTTARVDTADNAGGLTTGRPLFGVRSSPTPAPGTGDVGIAVAADMLLAGEGRRDIELCFDIRPMSELDADIAELKSIGSGGHAGDVLGSLFSRYLLDDDERTLDDIRAAFEQWLSLSSQSLSDRAEATREARDQIADYLSWDRRALFYFLLQDSLLPEVTTADGWYRLRDFLLYAPERTADTLRLRVRVSLGHEGPPVSGCDPALHGDRWGTSRPILRLLANPRAHFCPITLLQQMSLRRLTLALDVADSTEFEVSNQFGPVDTSSPFQAFGPQPASGAALIVGSRELAGKRPSATSVNVEWDALPRAPGGFRAHYRDYRGDYDAADFRIRSSVLVDGVWRRSVPGENTAEAMFETDPETGVSSGKARYAVQGLSHLRSEAGGDPEQPMVFGQDARNGFVRLALDCPPKAFGHSEYPGLTARAVARNTKLRVPVEMPAEPYTPVVRRISLDYRVETRLDLVTGAGGPDGSSECRLFHVHPFGVRTLAAGENASLFPMQDAASLFIGLRADTAAGERSLQFEIRADTAECVAIDPPGIEWRYLRANEWVALDERRIVHDTTAGLIKSGIVTLDLPDDIDRRHSIMPDERYWLQVSPKRDPQVFGTLRAIRTNAVRVVEVRDDTDAPRDRTPLGAGSIAGPASGIDGLAGVNQPHGSSGRRRIESVDALDTRISERLRHKRRAVTPWDYERIVLANFDSVFKVKCFAATSRSDPETASAPVPEAPGEVLLVVVPAAVDRAADPVVGYRLDLDELCRIRDFAAALSPPGASVQVRNPVYERIQLRCAVRFRDRDRAGRQLDRLNDDVNDFLSPWGRGSQSARFGWHLRCHNVESFIRELDYVDVVTGFSMLHVGETDSGRYSLGDTARQSVEHAGSTAMVRPRVPWALALPFRRHAIRRLRAAGPVAGRPAGIDDLEIGATFIL